MKYVRTKDGRIVEESKLEPGLKQNLITITRKNDNKEITQLIGDYARDYVNWFTICEYCRFHKINPKDIKYEITTLFNDVLKQADTIEKLCDRFVVIYENEEPVPYKNYLDALETQKEVYGAIWTDKGLIFVAKMNNKGVLELL